MMLQTESGIWADADARAFAILMAPNRTARRKLAAERTIDAAVRRVAALRRSQAAAASREHMRAERALEQEARELERAWGKTLRVRMPVPKKRVRTGERKAALRVASSLARQPRAYREPIKDKRGRVALIFITKYVGLKSKGWRPGLAAEHIVYIFRDAALEELDNALPPISNVGESVEEIAAFWTALETIEQGYRANAKVQHRIIWNLPHELNAEQRRQLVQSFCERTFGRSGLPYTAAIHAPDPNGDQRNFHAHICWSTRPFEHAGDYEWMFAAEKVNGLDDPAGLRRLRALAAAHMNLACLDAGLATRFTHQTYAQRGLDVQRQEHVGSAAMAAFRKGEDVAVIARNAAIVEANEASIEAQRSEEAVAASTRLIQLLRRRETLAEIRRTAADALARARAIAVSAKKALARVHRPDLAALQVRVARLHERASSITNRSAAPRRDVPQPELAIQMRRAAEQVTSGLSRQSSRHEIDQALIASIHLREQAKRLSGSTPRPAVFPLQTATALGVTATSIARKAAGRATPSLSLAPVQRLAETTPLMLNMSNRLRASRDRARIVGGQLARVDAALAQHRHHERHRREAAARAIILEAQTPPYRWEGERLVGVLSALTAEELSIVRAADRAVLEAAVRERVARDQERAKDEARQAAEKAEAEARAAAVRAALVADACRILRETKQRPYRRLQDGQVTPDWSDLAAADRAILDAVGAAEEQVRAALAERATSDQLADGRLARLFDVLETERHYLPKDGEHRTVDQRLLDFMAVEKSVLEEPKVQARLQAIADQRNGEIAVIIAYADASPAHFVRTAAGWSVGDAGPPDIRALVEAWSRNAVFEQALGRKLEQTRSQRIATADRHSAKPDRVSIAAEATANAGQGPGSAPSRGEGAIRELDRTPRPPVPPSLRSQGPGIGG